MMSLTQCLLKICFVLSISIVSLFVFAQIPVKALTEQQIAQQKAQKQQDLSRIMAEISAISSSNASVTSKITNLKSEKGKLEKLLGTMSEDLKIIESQTHQQELDLVKIANTYSLQQALYYVDSQKNLLVTLFESANLSNLLERFLYYNVQSQAMRKQREMIELKKEGIAAKRKMIGQEQAVIQKSLSQVTLQLATLENQQSQYAVTLSKSYSQRSSLVSDISKLSRAAQAILAKKVSSSSTTTGGGVGPGTSGGGVVSGSTTNTSTGAISIFIGGTLLKQTNSIVKMSAQNDEIKINGKFETEYAGTLEFNKSFGTLSNGTRIYVVNSLPLDKYLWGLAEMPSSWPLQALKVQAIAGRTYAVYKMRYAGYGNFDLLDYVQDQEYSGLSKIKSSYGSNWKTAVDSTSEKVLEYADKTPIAYYSADNAGHSVSGTESGFGSGGYLAAKSDRYLSGSTWKSYGSTTCGYWIIQGNKPNFPWCGQTRQSEGINTMSRMQDYLNGAIYYSLYGKMVTTGDLSSSQLQSLLFTNGKRSIQEKVGTITSIEHVYDVGGSEILENTKYTKFIVVTGSKGTYTVGGTAFKISYNVRAPYNNAVYSTLYDIKKIDSNNWELWTRGFGHRVGMSQYGAKGRADAGQEYEAILKYYYTNANVVQYDIGRNVRVALTKVGSRVMKVTSKSVITIYEGSILLKTVPANTEIRVEYN